MFNAQQNSGVMTAFRPDLDPRIVAADSDALAMAWLAVLGWGDPEALRFLANTLDRVDDEELGNGD